MSLRDEVMMVTSLPEVVRGETAPCVLGSAAQPIPVQGSYDPRFEAVREAFAASLARGDEQGAAVAVVADGRLVVDLWGGFADQAGTRPWEAGTLVNVASATKGVLAVALHRLVDEGRIDLDAPVAAYWPEFAQAGKGDIGIRSVLSHTSGLAAFRRKMRTEDIFDWDLCTEALAGQEPWWVPGERHGYHALTFGWLVGELVRRVTGRSPGALIKRLADQYAGGEIRVGLGRRSRPLVAEMGPYPVDDAFARRLRRGQGEAPSLPLMVFANPAVMGGDLVNTPAWRAACIPAANGHATARGLAKLYGALVGEDALLTPGTVLRCSTPAVRGPDLVLGIETCFSLGFMLGIPHAGALSFGHPGAGGSLGFCDPDAGFGFGYVVNRPEPTLHVGRRASRLLAALYDSCPAPR